jgi:uncharacterized repeat protein (TIGR03803 family)
VQAKAVVVLTFLLFSITGSQAATQRVLYSFTGGVDGGGPYSGVIFDPSGNLYGITQSGGVYGRGTVFQLIPSAGTWTETVLYSFTGGTDGEEPIGGLTIDEAGNLYGTASAGGDRSSGCGTVFTLARSEGSWTFGVLHTFAGGNDGCSPGSNLRYYAGHVYGTTVYGGPSNQGAVFTLPTSGGSDNVIPFSRNNGYQPWGGINIWSYGTTFGGGKNGEGNVYQWAGHQQILVKHTFNSLAKPGYHPLGDLLTQDAGGVSSMYGTNYSGGVGGRGTAYRLTESQYHNDVWAISVLHSFSGPDGQGPGAGLVLDPAGNLYGTTVFGGTDAGLAGTVYKLAPGPKKKWTYTLLYSFTDGIDGGEVYSGVVLDNAGNLYGTALSGGTDGWGVVYEVTP